MSTFYDHLTGFLQNRLQAFDPTIDLTPGSPAQLEIIEPLIARLGTDPFDMDIKVFMQQRLEEEFPDLITDTGEFEDLVINPLILFLDPFKQELNKIELSQSINNADLLDDTEVDALGANWFETRDEGGFSSGVARIFFSAPQNITVTTSRKIGSKSGLFFTPVQDTNITAAQMLFNREGVEYYIDINLIAENPGDEYNIDKQELISIDSLNGATRVTNLLPFTGGLPRESNSEFTSRIEQSLTERSLVTKRGVTSRVNNLFSAVRAIQVIGAGEEGMNRDILKGTGEGFIHLTGSALVFGNWVYIKQVYYKDDGITNNLVASIGDTLRFHRLVADDPDRTITETKITKVLWNVEDLYFLEVNTDLGNALSGYAAILKPGYITISDIPGGVLQATVADNTVHLGGHPDIYIRPSDDKVLSATINNLSDSAPLAALLHGRTTIHTNLFDTVSPDPTDLSTLNIQKGDSLVIESGTQAGTYRILEAGATLRVDNLFTASESNVRARIVRNITVNLNAPKIIKLPFNTTVSDLRTTIGSTLFILDNVNSQTYGTVIGDTIEILDGPDVGQFTITAFDTALGGQGLIVDRAAGATSASLRYQIYTLQDGLEFPLIRIRDAELLDSSNQLTGNKIPYGDAVDIVATCDFETVGDPVTVLDKQAFLFPDTNTYWNSLSNVFGSVGAGVDARYSQRLSSYDGKVRTFPANGGNPISTIELNIPPFAWDGKKNSLMGFVTMKDTNFTNDPSNNPQTSPLAEAKIGYSITLLNGPNAGTYLISDVRTFDLWGRSGTGHYKVAYVQIDGEFPTDPIRNAIDLIAKGNTDGSGVTAITGTELLKMLEWSTDWSNVSGFYENILIPRLRDTLTYYGFPATTNNVRDILNTISLTGYVIGPSSKGEVRTYFQEPVSVELYSDSTNPTLFQTVDQNVVAKSARISTDIKDGQILPQSFDDSPVSSWLRIGTQENPTSINYALTESPTFAKRGIETGDILEYYQAINEFPSFSEMNSSWIGVTLAGSNSIKLIMPATVHAQRVNAKVFAPGQLLFIDSGPDSGMYTITAVTAQTPYPILTLDRALTHTTNVFPDTGNFSHSSTLLLKAGGKRGYSTTVNAAASVDDWISIYAVYDNTTSTVLPTGNDDGFLGTYKVTAKGTDGVGDYVEFGDRSANFPGSDDMKSFWILHGIPTNIPSATTNGGVELSTQYIRIRTYDNVSQIRTITIDWTVSPNPLDSTSTAQIKLDSSISTAASSDIFSHKSPFRILRKFVKRIPSTIMANNREAGLYYFDLPAIAMGLGSEFNFKRGTTFKLGGNYNIHGYTYAVSDENLTYSTKEITSLVFPSSVLPVGSTPSQENEIKIAGQNIQINYDNAALVDEIQRFFDAPLDRVVSCNPLVRHFLPAYVMLELFYTGGSSEDVVAQDIIDYINGISPDDNELRVDAITRLLQKRSAKQITMPIELVALVHGLDRKIKAMRSENSIGIDFPVFKGVNKMVYFIPGPDTSKEETRPTGEQVFLKRS